MNYPPVPFRVSDRPMLIEFMRTYDFATIVSQAPDGLLTSHAPVLVRGTEEAPVIIAHLARSNPHWRAMDGKTPALVIFQGPHGYVSPAWYSTPNQVPTWNYSAVHAHGSPVSREEPAFLRGVVQELIERHEGGRAAPWNPDQNPEGFDEHLLPSIVGVELAITRLEGTFKLGQNKSVENRRGTIDGLRGEGSTGATSLAEFMSLHAGI